MTDTVESEQKVPLATVENAEKNPETTPERRNHWYGITNREWLCFKILYLFQYAAMGSFYPFCVVYYIARQLTPSQIGLMECTLPFMGALTKPIVAQIADRFNLHRVCLGFSILMYAAATVSLMFIRPPTDPVFPSYPVSLTCNEANQADSFSIENCDERSSGFLENLTLSQFSQVHIFAAAKSRHSSFYRKCDKSGDSCQITCTGRLDDLFSGQRLDKTGFGANLSSNSLIVQSQNLSTCHQYPGHFQTPDVGSLCSVGGTSGLTMESCFLDCYCSSKRSEIDPTSTYINSESAMSSTATFGIILAIRLVAAASYSPIFSLEDSIVYTTLGPKNRLYWGQQKMFGQLAFGVLALITGLLIDKWAFDVAFIANGVLNLGAVFVSFFWVPQPQDVATKKRAALNGPQSGSAEPIGCCGSIKKVFQGPMFIIAMFIAFFSGIFIGIIFVITPQWQIHLGGQGGLIGATAITGCFLQAIGFAFSGLVVRRFGEVICFLGTFLFFAIRYLAYSFLTPSTVWISIPLEITQIFCFSFYLSAMTNYADTVAPKGMSATIQAILQTSYFGFGTGIGILTSGAIYERIGGQLTFQIYSLGAAICFVILLLVYLTFLRKRLYGNKKQHEIYDEKARQQTIEEFLEKGNEDDL